MASGRRRDRPRRVAARRRLGGHAADRTASASTACLLHDALGRAVGVRRRRQQGRRCRAAVGPRQGREGRRRGGRRRACAACSATCSRRAGWSGWPSRRSCRGPRRASSPSSGYAYPYGPDGNGGPPILDELAWGAPRGGGRPGDRARSRCSRGSTSRAAAPRLSAPMRLVDSHCHLNADRFEADADQVVGGARLAGVERILVPGWNVASCERALALVDALPVARRRRRRPSARRGQGRRRRLGRIVELAADDRGSSRSARPASTTTGSSARSRTSSTNLRRNLALALETGKPAILHCRSAAGRRDAQDALLAELRAAGSATRRGPPHSAIGRRRSSTRISGPLDYAPGRSSTSGWR